MDSKLFEKLVKNKKILDWWIQIFNEDWLYKKPSERKGYAFFENVYNGQIIEWKISDITSIGDMDVNHWLNSVNCDKDGNLTYLEINFETDFHKDIEGKKEYKLSGIDLINNMTLVLKNDISEDIRNKALILTGIGTKDGIKLKRNKGRPRFAR